MCAQAEKLALRHEIEKLQDRLEATEAQVLDPTSLQNVKFAHVKVRRAPSAAWSHLAGSGNLRGRLQNMVPPTVAEMASPAPVAFANASRGVVLRAGPAWVS